MQAFTGADPSDTTKESHPIHASHSSTFFAEMLEEVQAIAKTSSPRQRPFKRSNSLAAVPSSNYLLGAMVRDELHGDAEPASVEDVAGKHGVEESLMRHLSLTRSAARRLNRSKTEPPHRPEASALPTLPLLAPRSAKAVAAPVAALAEERGAHAPCSHARRDSGEASTSRPNGARNSRENGLQRSSQLNSGHWDEAPSELDRRKKRVEIEWYAQRWRRTARQYLAGTGRGSEELSKSQLSTIGDVAIRALQAKRRRQRGARR